MRLLVSHWSHSNPASVPFLRSLADISRAYPHVDVQVVSFYRVSARIICHNLFFFTILCYLTIDLENICRSCHESWPGENPFCSSESQQVHGHRSGGLYRYSNIFTFFIYFFNPFWKMVYFFIRYFQLVRWLLYQYWRWFQIIIFSPLISVIL